MNDERLLFLAEDLRHLRDGIDDVREQIRRAKHESAESVEQSSESWHDNFTFEEAQRQLRMLLNHLAGLSKSLERAELVTAPTDPRRAEVGTRVRFRDETTGLEDEIVIGSAMVGPVMAARGCVSYLAPLGKLLHRAGPGEKRTGQVGGRSVDLEIVAIGTFDENETPGTNEDVTKPGRRGP